MYRDTLKSTNIFEKIVADTEAGRLRHAYLITAADRAALKALAEIIAAEMYCLKQRACMECAGCRGVTNRTNPDVRFYEGLNKDTVAEVVLTSKERPYGAKHKTYIITDFHTVREDSQNKLLKTLEEPSDDTVFVLFVASVAGVLPTIVSRCEQITLSGLDIKSLGRELRELNPRAEQSELEAALSFGGGTIEGAERYLSGGEEYKAIVDLGYSIVTGMKKSNRIIEYAAAVVKLKGPALIDLMGVLALIVRDIMAYKSGTELLFPQRKNDIINVSEEFSTAACVKIIDKINYALDRLSNNGNPVSVVDELLFSFLEVKALCR